MNKDVKPFNINAEFHTTSDQVLPKPETVELDTQHYELLGSHVRVGQVMPKIELTTHDMKPFLTGDQEGKNTIYVIMPSLDTAVCNSQFSEFSKAIENENLTGVDFVFVTSDTPFALQRFQKTENSPHIMVSDAANHLFGYETGLQLSSLNVLARAIIVTNKENKIVHKQIVPKLTELPCLHSAYISLFKE